jgi:hypothetical protein
VLSLEIGNDRASIQVSPDAQLTIRLIPEGQFGAKHMLSDGSIALRDRAPLSGLLYYALPCVFEGLIVRVEGVASPALQSTLGRWPPAVDDDDLDAYPHLHFVEERKTGAPWRFERWYTLAGSHLVFESDQYFERACPAERGQNWERFIVQLRQVVHLPALAGDSAKPEHLLVGGDAIG